jgi:L-iditol 2-dehydrogenase
MERDILTQSNTVHKGGKQAHAVQELTVLSTYSSSPEELRIALDLLAQRAVRVDTLISHRHPLDSFQEGVRLMRERVALKVYFRIAQTTGEAYGK